MKKYLLVSNLDNHNIGVLNIKIDTNKTHDIRSAVGMSKLKTMLNEENGVDDVELGEINVVSNGDTTPITITVQIKRDGGEYEDEITLEETWVY